MRTTRNQNLIAIAFLCGLCLTGIFPPKAWAATVVITTGPGRYYHHGVYYKYHPMFGGYYNYYHGGRYYVYYYNGNYYNRRIWVAPAKGRRGYYRYW